MPNARQLAALAAVVQCDIRTVRSYFAGERVLPVMARAIEDAWNRARAGETLTVAVIRGDGEGSGVTRMA